MLESVLRILATSGLPPGGVRPVVASLFSLVRGAARSVAEGRSAAAATGTSDQEWWTLRSRLIQRIVPDFDRRFPFSTRLAASASHGERQVADTFTEGLGLLLDGVESRARHRPR